MKRTISVTIDIGSDIDTAEIALFVCEALSTWGGQRCPDDPLFTSLALTRIQVSQDKFIAKDGELEIVI